MDDACAAMETRMVEAISTVEARLQASQDELAACKAVELRSLVV